MSLHLLQLLLLLLTSQSQAIHHPIKNYDTATKLFHQWIQTSSIPGNYLTIEERNNKTTHPGDLNNHVIFSKESLRSGQSVGGWPHTEPNHIYNNKNNKELEISRKAIAFHLQKGISRLQDTILMKLKQVEDSPDKLTQVLTLGRRAIRSFESFWKQVTWTFDYGKKQIEWTNKRQPGKGVWKEYGPETNFWLKFRPTLTCSETFRMGPEIGGAKTWCNAESLSPKVVLSAGSGDDFLYEHLVAEKWPGVTIVTTDCYQFDQASELLPFEAAMRTNENVPTSHIIVLPVCLTGGENTTRKKYIQLAPSHLHSKFVSFSNMLQQLKTIVQADTTGRLTQDYFDLIKCNIEASEYPLFADVFRNVDENLKGTKQINMEMHRMGMHTKGKNFNSLIFMNLLFSHFYSGGFHPVFTEKWHDQHAAQDVVWVNQTSWIESELEMSTNIWNDGKEEKIEKIEKIEKEKKKNQKSERSLVDLFEEDALGNAKRILALHLDGEDPFASPISTLREIRNNPSLQQLKSDTMDEEEEGNQERFEKLRQKHFGKEEKIKKNKRELRKKNKDKPKKKKQKKNQKNPNSLYDNDVLFGADTNNKHEFTQTVLMQLRKDAYDAIGFVMLVPHDCSQDEKCALFPEFWTKACHMYPNHIYISHCSSVPGIGNCGPEVPSPTILEWDGLTFQGYAGEKSLAALLQHLHLAIDVDPDMSMFMQGSGGGGGRQQQQQQQQQVDREGEMEANVKNMESLFGGGNADADGDDDGGDDDDDEFDWEEDDDDEFLDEEDDGMNCSEDGMGCHPDKNERITHSEDGMGSFKKIAVEMVDELSHEEFVKKYVNTKTPVVLRKSIKRKTSLKWIKSNCDMDGEHANIHVFELDSESKGWAGFDFDSKTERPLGEFLKQLWTSHRETRKSFNGKKKNRKIQNNKDGSVHPGDERDERDEPIQYGFDYRLACNCPKLLDRMPQLRYFQGDILAINPSFPRVNWPVLIAGATGSSSSLHVDAHFLPFYLTQMSGKKQFRIITLEDWRKYLVDELYDNDGAVLRPFNAYKNDVIKTEILERGANLWGITLEVGKILLFWWRSLY